MSLNQFLATNVKLKSFRNHMWKEYRKIFSEDMAENEVGWFFAEDISEYWSSLKTLFQKEYIVEIHSDFQFNLKSALDYLDLSKAYKEELYLIEKRNSARTNKMGEEYRCKRFFDVLIDYLRKSLPRGEEALFYTVYNNKPIFEPLDKVIIDLKTFDVPYGFAFEEHVLYVLKN